MSDSIAGVQHNGQKPYKHKALYHAVTKQRWTVFQKRVLHFWEQKDALRVRSAFTRRYYLPLFKSLFQDSPEDISILEIGSGPVCTAQYLQKGSQTYIDPLLDDFKRLFPGKMPEDATYITEMAEKVNLPKQSFDVILCLNTLSDVHNPELVLTKVEQLLKKDGLFIVSIDVWPYWLARLHLFLSRLAPGIPQINRLYSYTQNGFYNTLTRHFDLVTEQRVGTTLESIALSHERLYVCRHKTK